MHVTYQTVFQLNKSLCDQVWRVTLVFQEDMASCGNVLTEIRNLKRFSACKLKIAKKKESHNPV